MVYDSKWLGYAKDMLARKLASDPASIAAAQMAYNDAANSDYDINKVAIANDALNAMIDANGFKPSPAQPVTLDTITVTGNIPQNDIKLELAQPDLMVKDLAPPHVDVVLDSDVHFSSFQLGTAPKEVSYEGISEAAAYTSLGFEVAQHADTLTTKLSTINILDRARNLQMPRIDAVAHAKEYEELEGMFSESSQSGKLISKWAPLAKSLKLFGVGADLASLEADVLDAPADKIPLVVAQDATSFAAEAGAVEFGATIGAWVGGTVGLALGPFEPLGIAVGGAIGGAAGAIIYNWGAENKIKALVSDFVTAAPRAIDEVPRTISEDLHTATHPDELFEPINQWFQWVQTGPHAAGPYFLYRADQGQK